MISPTTSQPINSAAFPVPTTATLAPAPLPARPVLPPFQFWVQDCADAMLLNTISTIVQVTNAKLAPSLWQIVSPATSQPRLWFAPDARLDTLWLEIPASYAPQTAQPARILPLHAQLA